MVSPIAEVESVCTTVGTVGAHEIDHKSDQVKAQSSEVVLDGLAAALTLPESQTAAYNAP